jgi:DNA polymerase-3 subunit delta'
VSDLPYLRVTGHAAVRRALAKALRAGRLPQTLLLHGPRGVGKQRLALWLAALVQCQETGTEPCGRCTPCRLAGRLAHPDIHWFFPTERPRGASPEKTREMLEELRAAELEARRANPAYTRPGHGDAPVAIYLGAAQTLRALLAARPAMGRHTVAVIGDAETLVPQEASPEAANALLETLEEPPATARIVLTTSAPGALLPTLRSRCHPLHVPPLAQSEVAAFLRDEIRIPDAEARELARRASGSIGRALELLREEQASVREQAEEILRAALDPHPGARLALAHRFQAFGARGAFLRVLDELQLLLRDRLLHEARTATRDRENPDAIDRSERPGPNTAEAVLAVGDARGMADRNMNPQLIVAGLLHRLHILLSIRPQTSGTAGSREPGPSLEG